MTNRELLLDYIEKRTGQPLDAFGVVLLDAALKGERNACASILRDEKALYGDGQTYCCPGCGANTVHPGTLMAAGLGLAIQLIEKGKL